MARKYVPRLCSKEYGQKVCSMAVFDEMVLARLFLCSQSEICLHVTSVNRRMLDQVSSDDTVCDCRFCRLLRLRKMSPPAPMVCRSKLVSDSSTLEAADSCRRSRASAVDAADSCCYAFASFCLNPRISSSLQAQSASASCFCFNTKCKRSPTACVSSFALRMSLSNFCTLFAWSCLPLVRLASDVGPCLVLLEQSIELGRFLAHV
jgi:hypothetical protein